MFDVHEALFNKPTPPNVVPLMLKDRRAAIGTLARQSGTSLVGSGLEEICKIRTISKPFDSDRRTGLSRLGDNVEAALSCPRLEGLG